MPSTGFKLPAGRTIDAGSGTWTNDVNVLADDGLEATFSLTTKNASGRWLHGNTFGFNSAIPAGATITQVQIRCEYRVNSTGGIANPEMAVFVGGVQQGTTRACSPLEPTTLTLNTFDVTADRAWTRADLLDGQLVVSIRGRNGNSTTDPSYRWDHLAVEVVYSEAPAGDPFTARIPRRKPNYRR
jgi:phage tail sheath gpL-like